VRITLLITAPVAPSAVRAVSEIPMPQARQSMASTQAMVTTLT
jgi:hypothetical protein